MLILHQQPTSTTVKCWFHKNAWPQRYSFGLWQNKLPELTPFDSANPMSYSSKSWFREKIFRSSHWEISVSSTSQKYENVTTRIIHFFVPLSAKWSLPEIKNKGKLTVFWSYHGVKTKIQRSNVVCVHSKFCFSYFERQGNS